VSHQLSAQQKNPQSAVGVHMMAMMDELNGCTCVHRFTFTQKENWIFAYTHYTRATRDCQKRSLVGAVCNRTIMQWAHSAILGNPVTCAVTNRTYGLLD